MEREVLSASNDVTLENVVQEERMLTYRQKKNDYPLVPCGTPLIIEFSAEEQGCMKVVQKVNSILVQCVEEQGQ